MRVYVHTYIGVKTWYIYTELRDRATSEKLSVCNIHIVITQTPMESKEE